MANFHIRAGYLARTV